MGKSKSLLLQWGTLFATTLLFLPVSSLADDTVETRTAAAKAYLRVVTPNDMMSNMATEIAKTLPETQRQQYIDMMTKHFNLSVMENAMLKSMVKHFTTKELNALAAFHSTPEGKSSMKKMGVYMADVMPVIQKEMMLASQRVQSEKLPPSAPSSP